MDIANELKNFAESKKAEMSVNVYNYLWNIVQSIEHDEETRKRNGQKVAEIKEKIII